MFIYPTVAPHSSPTSKLCIFSLTFFYYSPSQIYGVHVCIDGNWFIQWSIVNQSDHILRKTKLSLPSSHLSIIL